MQVSTPPRINTQYTIGLAVDFVPLEDDAVTYVGLARFYGMPSLVFEATWSVKSKDSVFFTRGSIKLPWTPKC